MSTTWIVADRDRKTSGRKSDNKFALQEMTVSILRLNRGK